MTQYTQCLLGRGTERQTAWIEKRGAGLGNSVELKTEEGTFWTVLAVYDTIDAAELKEHQTAARSHRKATDI
jgi:hypothetical protein